MFFEKMGSNMIYDPCFLPFSEKTIVDHVAHPNVVFLG
jgi:hypothetical protein